MGRDWDSRWADAAVEDAGAAAVLRDNAHLLPAAGRALDLAAGLGGNARLLAAHGLETDAWDRSATAAAKLDAWARAASLAMNVAIRDVVADPPAPATFDVIVVSRFLERSIAPALIEALRPGGLLYYQTFTRTGVTGRGPRDPRFRLAEGELLSLFAPLQVLVYREEGAHGDTRRGLRDEAQLVACRPRA